MSLLIIAVILMVGLFLVVVFVIGGYNKLVTLRNRSKTPTRKLTCNSSAATT